MKNVTAERLQLGQLGQLGRLAAGGQGVVYRAPGVRMAYASSLVFKEYKADVRAGLNVAVLDAMPTYLESLPFADGMELLSRAAWPCRLVEDAPGSVAGFVMPTIPDEFFIDMAKASGVTRVAAEFQHLLNDPVFLARRGIGLTDRLRYQLIAETALALIILHRHGISVGDLSPKNLLFALAPHPKVYFIDCDAMRFQGRSVTTQLETPGWDIHSLNTTEELATVATDSYKLGLLALRLLVGDQDTRDPNRLPPQVPGPVRALVQAALSTDPATRTAPGAWCGALAAAAAAASTKPPHTTLSASVRGSAPPPTHRGGRPAITPRPSPMAPRFPPPAGSHGGRGPTALPQHPTPTPKGRRPLLIGVAAIAAVIAAALYLTRGSGPSSPPRVASSAAAPTVSVTNVPAVHDLNQSSLWTGTWRAPVSGDSSKYDVEVTLYAQGSALRGEVSYPQLNCGGTWTERYVDGDTRGFRETIDHGTTRCIVSGDLTLTRQADALLFEYSSSSSGRTLTAHLTRV